MKIAFFTPRSINPLHPRLVAYDRFFREKGVQVDYINCSDYKPSIASRLNWLSLYFFDTHAVKKCLPFIAMYDLIIVTDMKYLPLVRYAKRAGKIVWYETIDHNVYLRFYQLENKIPAARVFKNQIIKHFLGVEKQLTTKYCNEVIVNSDSLKQYFEGRATTLFYSSPFENMLAFNDPVKPAALLYLGAFTSDKGAERILELQDSLTIPLFIFGSAPDASLLQRLRQNTNVHYTPKLSSADLTAALVKLFNEYFFFGFSLIKPVHYSYEVQEANKDIDYLCMGIPLIGNRRITTKVKVEAGCGLFEDDPKLEEKILDSALRNTLAENCRAYYHSKYHSSIFASNLEALYSTAIASGTK
jgi:hypothetical protein